MSRDITVTSEAKSGKARAKYWTLFFLVLWVIAVFVFTILKLSGTVK